MKYIRLVIFASVLAGALACQKEPQKSATDPLPFPLEADKDLTVQPGDNFWQYCNGAWYAQTETPDDDAVGALYDMQPVMDGLVETISAKDPSLKKFFELLSHMYEDQEEGAAYVAALQAQFPATAQTQEEACKLLGQMIAHGLTPIQLELTTDFKDGKLIGMLSVSKLALPYKYAFSDLPEAVRTQTGWVVEGMGLNPQDIYFNDISMMLLSSLPGMSAEQIMSLIPMGWLQLYPFLSEAGLAQYNASFSESWDKDYAAIMARGYLGYEVSYHLAQECITDELKAHYIDLVERLRTSFRARMQKLDWMSETTRSSAIEKLDKMMVFAGCPDTWYMDCMPDLSQCKSLVEAVYLLKCAKVELTKKLLGTSDVFSNSLTGVSRSATGYMVTDLSLVNAYYKREYNCIVMHPAMMLPPLIRSDYSDAYEYGMLCTAAHEITHGFDTNGSQYDAIGRKADWWTVADKMAFEDEQAKLVNCFNHLEYDPLYPGVYADGQRTLAENLADLGGFLLARDAYITRVQEQGFTGEAYREQLRKFHEAYAHLYCCKYSAAKLLSIIQEDNHSHCRLRVNGIVMNTDMWYDLYGVTRDNLLYLPPERRTRIW